jgi:hypothetical protein
VNLFFSKDGVFRHSVHITEGDDQTDKQYEITFPSLARYFHTHFESGVQTIQLFLDKGISDRPLPGDCHSIENKKASLVYWFDTGSHVSCALFVAKLPVVDNVSLACGNWHTASPI